MRSSKPFIIIGKLMVTLLLLQGVVSAQPNTVESILSPDKQTVTELRVNTAGNLEYQLRFKNKQVLSWSALGLNIDGKIAGQHSAILHTTISKHNETIAWPLGEDSHIDNMYEEKILQCQSPGVLFNIVVRVFNGSVAFRYELPGANSVSRSIHNELTTYNLTAPYLIYQYHAETVFTPVHTDSLTANCDFPATLREDKKFYISIGEADNLNYTKAELKKGETANSLQVAFPRDSAVKFSGAYQTPWRTVSCSETAIGLHQFSQLYLKLNPPPAVMPTLVKPGKLIRAQLNTQAGIDCIDFASAHNFQYIMFDAGWYGAEFRTVSDPTVSVPALDLPQVIQYGKTKGIGVILYVNYVGLRMKLDTILPLYKKWGVAGMKFGFVDGLTQNGLQWLSAAMKKVNDYGFILDIHDNYKPTGLSRTYPALLTQEGIRGDENSPDAFHTTVLPFTRFLAGPADFTFCYPNSKTNFAKNLKVSKAQQMALTVVFFSPLQSIFWYGNPNDYKNEQEIEFFKYVPTVWDESIYLDGEIGEYISVARKKNNVWYVGNAAGLNDWKGNMRFSFLTNGKQYKATVYEDDSLGGVHKVERKVRKDDVWPIDIKAKEGQAIIIREDVK